VKRLLMRTPCERDPKDNIPDERHRAIVVDEIFPFDQLTLVSGKQTAQAGEKA